MVDDGNMHAVGRASLWCNNIMQLLVGYNLSMPWLLFCMPLFHHTHISPSYLCNQPPSAKANTCVLKYNIPTSYLFGWFVYTHNDVSPNKSKTWMNAFYMYHIYLPILVKKNKTGSVQMQHKALFVSFLQPHSALQPCHQPMQASRSTIYSKLLHQCILEVGRSVLHDDDDDDAA